MITAAKKLPVVDISRVLKPIHRAHGLQLGESGSIVTLFLNGSPVAKFSGYGATILSIQQEADKWLPGNDAIQNLIDVGGINITREILH